MEAMLSFITKFNDVVRSHIEETKQCIGKEVVDSNASKAGVCIDRIKHSFGAKFSMLGHNYDQKHKDELDAFKEDVLVCQGNNGQKFFVPASQVVANGENVILVKPALNQPEVGSIGRKREDLFRRYFKTKTAIRQFLPKVSTPAKRTRKKKSVLRFFH